MDYILDFLYNVFISGEFYEKINYFFYKIAYPVVILLFIGFAIFAIFVWIWEKLKNTER